MAWTCHPHAPNTLAPPPAPLGTTRAPLHRKTTHALERCSVERPTRLWTLLWWGNSGSTGLQGVAIICVGTMWAWPMAAVVVVDKIVHVWIGHITFPLLHPRLILIYAVIVYTSDKKPTVGFSFPLQFSNNFRLLNPSYPIWWRTTP